MSEALNDALGVIVVSHKWMFGAYGAALAKAIAVMEAAVAEAHPSPGDGWVELPCVHCGQVTRYHGVSPTARSQ